MDSAAHPPRPKRLADYRPPDWLVPRIDLRMELDPARTIVHARMEVERNGPGDAPLLLDGEDVELLSLKIDGVEQPLPNPTAEGLSLTIASERAVVETMVAIRPAANTRLMGLYLSGGNLCTQCEAEGFRRITFFPDRPDVLSRYRTRLEADRAAFPVLLGNGNPVASGPLPDGRHFAEWDDPFPKPSYLFACVAGQLAALEDRFVTASGREVKLAIWVAPADLDRCHHAMQSLKQAMAFDEQVYGREYDLDQFNIVAVRDFNFGAMENKGLNIFNAKFVLADPDTATDWDYDSIAAIVGHEYFHNWSGNRVTCRDWFQLSLKEGFTVFRDQHFMASIGSAAVKRIESVRQLRASQFAEDAGPLAHPVRPDSYLEISNFYTATVYDKGAELIRMMASLLGPERFRAATDRYFELNDGRAATVEDFLEAMSAQGLDGERFRRWYEQPGTPLVEAEMSHDPVSRQVRLRFRQSNPKAGPEALPLPIPLRFALFDGQGAKVHQDDSLLLTEREMAVLIDDVAEQPILSLNRGFAAPIIAYPAPDRPALKLLAAHEDDPFARYEALQQLMLSAIIGSVGEGQPLAHQKVVDAVAAALDGWEEDPALIAESILPPSEGLIADQMGLADPPAIHSAREALRRALADQLHDRLWAIYDRCDTDGADLSGRAKGLRRLKGLLLSLLTAGGDRRATEAAFRQFQTADSMTDRMSALTALSHSDAPEREEALRLFHDRYQALPEVLDKWFLVQASSIRPDTGLVVKALTRHPAFDPRNPNRLRSLILGFANNQARFHDAAGEGYRLLAEQLLAVDRLNPQSASRLAAPLTRWRRLMEPYGSEMRATLKQIAATSGLSRDLSEVVVTGLR